MRLALASILGFALFAAVPAQAADPRLVPDVSSRAIDIQYSFTGEELLLFGAILYPGQRLPDDRADIVVVLKGPMRPIVLREWQSDARREHNSSFLATLRAKYDVRVEGPAAELFASPAEGGASK